MFNKALKSELMARTAELATYKGLVGALERSMAVVEFSPDGKVLRANENFLSTMGYRADQLAGLSHRDFCTSALAGSAEYREFWNQLRAGQFVSGTFQRVGGQGQHIWLEASYNPVKDENGRVVKVVKYALDVTAKVASEAETRGRLAALDRAMAVIEFDLGGNVLTANDSSRS